MAPKIDKTPEKCSAVSTMERAMPDFDYSKLVDELRTLIVADIDREPERFDKSDAHNIKTNNWTIARYLLRSKLDVKDAHKMMLGAFDFRNSAKMNLRQFPSEFYQIGAIFSYEPDRKANIPVYIRVKLNQKIAVVNEYLKAFLFRVIDEADVKAQGRGIVLIFDLQGAGIGNVDMDLLYFVISTLVNYFPKGLSYMLVHELPWILQSVWTITKQWLSEEHKDLIKFSNSANIYEYFCEENLPDFMGGTCKRSYRQVPENHITINQAAKMWNINETEILKIRKKFAEHLPKDLESSA